MTVAQSDGAVLGEVDTRTPEVEEAEWADRPRLLVSAGCYPVLWFPDGSPDGRRLADTDGRWRTTALGYLFTTEVRVKRLHHRPPRFAHGMRYKASVSSRDGRSLASTRTPRGFGDYDRDLRGRRLARRSRSIGLTGALAGWR